MTVTEQLKTEIDDLGITYTWIHKKTGIPVKTLSSIFLGNRKLLAGELIAICVATGIDINKFKKPAS